MTLMQTACRQAVDRLHTARLDLKLVPFIGLFVASSASRASECARQRPEGCKLPTKVWRQLQLHAVGTLQLQLTMQRCEQTL